MLRPFAIVLLFAVIGTQADLFCYDDVKQECASEKYGASCTSTYGNFPNVVSKFQQYANTHLARSMQALMVAKHFSNYQYARNGFHDFFLDFSDSLFDQAVSLIRYTNNRGSSMDFKNFKVHDETHGFYEFNEVQSLSWALDVEKNLAQEAIDINALVGGTNANYHDADANYYLSTKYSYRHRINVKHFADYYVKLEKMLTSKNQMLVLYDFDGYLGTD